MKGMKIGLLTRNVDAWCSSQLMAAMYKKNIEPVPLRFQKLAAWIGFKHKVSSGSINLQELDALIVRPLGPGSLDECLLRVDILHKLARSGLTIVNHPSAIERCIDKYYTLSYLEEHGIKTPRTIVTESVEEALNAFKELGEDIVCKPLFGSRGIGVTRLTDYDVASRVFRTLAFNHHVIYMQEFIPHGTKDIRAFVIGGRVVASMYREASSWKTNVSQGARPVPLELNRELEELAVEAASLMGCDVAGVDIMESGGDYYLTEVNSQPGWRGLQSVTKVNIAEAIVDHVVSKVKGA